MFSTLYFVISVAGQPPKVLMAFIAMTGHIHMLFYLTLDQQVVFSVARIRGVLITRITDHDFEIHEKSLGQLKNRYTNKYTLICIPCKVLST